MISTLHQWALDHRVDFRALRDLQMRLGLLCPTIDSVDPPEHAGKSEAFVQSLVKLRASQDGITVTRNNSGALIPKDGGKRLVRFGLFNESEAQNEVVKSPDLFGWRKLLISPDMVGTHVAQTWARECKEPGWVYTGTGREVAQLACINMINSAGGDAAFSTGVGL
jgi:hypothetical protein